MELNAYVHQLLDFVVVFECLNICRVLQLVGEKLENRLLVLL